MAETLSPSTLSQQMHYPVRFCEYCQCYVNWIHFIDHEEICRQCRNERESKKLQLTVAIKKVSLTGIAVVPSPSALV